MKLGQFIAILQKNIFHQKNSTKMAWKLVPGPLLFFKSPQ